MAGLTLKGIVYSIFVYLARKYYNIITKLLTMIDREPVTAAPNLSWSRPRHRRRARPPWRTMVPRHRRAGVSGRPGIGVMQSAASLAASGAAPALSLTLSGFFGIFSQL
jgi:hypothetical protein